MTRGIAKSCPLFGPVSAPLIGSGAGRRLFCTNLWNTFLNMRQKRFLIYFLIQVLVIGVVIALFKLNSDVKLASVEAGALFFLWPLYFAVYELRKFGTERKSFFVGLIQFWLLFALPILGLRLMNWEAPFDDLSIFGVPGTLLHKYANTSYLLMMGLTLWNYFVGPRKLKDGEVRS